MINGCMSNIHFGLIETKFCKSLLCVDSVRELLGIVLNFQFRFLLVPFWWEIWCDRHEGQRGHITQPISWPTGWNFWAKYFSENLVSNIKA